jgi:hypothetical protein
MNIRKYLIISISGLLLLGCSYLDIVPDNTITLEDYFANKEQAYNALSKVYSYMPETYSTYSSEFFFGDEWVSRENNKYSYDFQPPQGVMMGGQNNENVRYGLWTGSGGAQHLYKALRACNTFLDNIGMAVGMSEIDRKNWIAQVKFMKAYYHYQLILYYGPMVIVDSNVNIDDPDDKILPRRSKVDECFNYVINLINEAIPDLEDRVSEIDLGMVDKCVAKAIKARVLLMRASPFFNGNQEYYADFLDFDGQPFFPMQEETQKWRDALEAVNDAISQNEKEDAGLYNFDGRPYSKEDDDFFMRNPERMQTYYTLRMVIADRWNKELIWGRPHSTAATDVIQYICAIRNNNEDDTDWSNSNFNGNYQGASYRMLETYYTKNGLPIEADKTFDQSSKYDLVYSESDDSEAFSPWIGIVQPDIQTISLYLNRELRFYANLGITGGYWRQHRLPIPTMMYSATNGGVSFSHSGGTENYFWSGIGVQKYVHPESRNAHQARMEKFPYPIIRMADLYLMKAEILNELNGPGPEVWEEINKIRRRAGIPDIETAYSDGSICSSNYLNSHTDKSRLRNIILRERSIEFAFEGSRFFDMRRYKRAFSEFNSPTMGWEGNAATADEFFILRTKQKRLFSMRDNLWPIPAGELNKNPNLIQNPSW